MKPEAGEIRLGERRISFTVARSRRRRRTIAFVMESREAIKITAPVRASLSSIHAALQHQLGWIKRRLAEFERAGTQQPKIYHGGGMVAYLGHACRLDITHDKDRPQGCLLRPRRLHVNLHAGDLVAADLQEEVKLEILLWMKKRAKVKFHKRMDFWARRLGVDYRKMIVANAERRWGSCSVQNVIRLSWKLIMAPLPILDYVVVHELCHVRHKNHGPRFWAQVAAAMPHWKALRKQLRMIGGGLAL